MTERRIDVPGGRLAVHDFGEGPPIVLLHAGIVTSWAWEPLTPFLLDAGYRVVAFDRRGAGDSSTQDVAFSSRADTIAVLDALGLGRAALVGNSVGGQIALDTAIEAPDRVTAVVTIGSIGARLVPRHDARRRRRSRLSWSEPSRAATLMPSPTRTCAPGSTAPVSRPTAYPRTSASSCVRWIVPSTSPEWSAGARFPCGPRHRSSSSA